MLLGLKWNITLWENVTSQHPLPIGGWDVTWSDLSQQIIGTQNTDRNCCEINDTLRVGTASSTESALINQMFGDMTRRIMIIMMMMIMIMSWLNSYSVGNFGDMTGRIMMIIIKLSWLNSYSVGKFGDMTVMTETPTRWVDLVTWLGGKFYHRTDDGDLDNTQSDNEIWWQFSDSKNDGDSMTLRKMANMIQWNINSMKWTVDWSCLSQWSVSSPTTLLPTVIALQLSTTHPSHTGKEHEGPCSSKPELLTATQHIACGLLLAPEIR